MTRHDRRIDISRHARPTPTITVSTRSVRPLLGYLRSRGSDVSALLREEGIDPAHFDDLEARLPHDTAIALWARAVRLTEDPDIGLHVSEAIQPGMFGAVEYVARTSPTVGTAFERLFRYHRVFHDVAETRLERSDDHAVLSHRLPLPGGAPRHVSDAVVTAWLTGGRQLAGVKWTPLEVRFPHAQPADTSEYRRVFNAPVTFGHARSELVVSRHVLDLPLATADAALQPIVEAQVSALLERLPAGESAIDAVRRVLADELCDGEPTLERAATRLHMSARTLHRRLAEHGTSFRRVVGQVRRDLAERYLRDKALAIGEIAFLLGFSEPSAFHRAFKRWTGHPPRAYREGEEPAG